MAHQNALTPGGRTNKWIAELIHLSPHTIDDRPQRVDDKLDISGRPELSDVLAEAIAPGIPPTPDQQIGTSGGGGGAEEAPPWCRASPAGVDHPNIVHPFVSTATRSHQKPPK